MTISYFNRLNTIDPTTIAQLWTQSIDQQWTKDRGGKDVNKTHLDDLIWASMNRCTSCGCSMHKRDTSLPKAQQHAAYSTESTHGHLAIPVNAMGAKKGPGSPLTQALGIDANTAYHPLRSDNSAIQCGFCQSIQGHMPGPLVFQGAMVGMATPGGGTVRDWAAIQVEIEAQTQRLEGLYGSPNPGRKQAATARATVNAALLAMGVTPYQR